MGNGTGVEGKGSVISTLVAGESAGSKVHTGQCMTLGGANPCGMLVAWGAVYGSGNPRAWFTGWAGGDRLVYTV